MTDLTTMSAPQAQRELLRQLTAAIARAEAAEATIKRLDDLGGELATPSVWLRGGHSIEVIIHEYFRLKAELATLREQLAAHEWRPLPPPPDAD